MLNSCAIQELVRLLALRMQREARSALAGLYSSRFRGRGLEFAELLEYQDGDDASSIDWHSSLRCGRIYRKRYQEEREMPVLLVCDCSASLYCQAQVLQAMRDAAALFAGCAAASMDPAGLLFFSDHVERRLPPERGLRQTRRLLAELYEFQPSGRGTDLTALFRCLGNAFRQPCRMFVFSDLYATGYADALGRLARIHDVLICHLAAPPWQELPRGLWLDVEDAESGERALLHPPATNQQTQRQEKLRQHLQGSRQRILEAGADYLFLPADQPVAANILHFFRPGARG